MDKISDNIAIYINSLDYKVSILNTYGRLYYKVPFHTKGVEVDAGGIPTGIICEKANVILRKNIMNNYSDKKRKEDILKLIPKLLKLGLTTINTMEGGYIYSDKDSESVYQNLKKFSIDTVLCFQCPDLEEIKHKQLERVGGSLYIDGTISARTAALSFEDKDSPGKKEN